MLQDPTLLERKPHQSDDPIIIVMGTHYTATCQFLYKQHTFLPVENLMCQELVLLYLDND